MKFATGLAVFWTVLVGMLSAGDPDTPCFRDDFQNGLGPAWHVIAGQAKVAEQADQPGLRFLELSPGSVVMLQTGEPLRNFVIEAKVRFIKRKGDNAEAPFLVRAQTRRRSGPASLPGPAKQCRARSSVDCGHRPRKGVLAGSAQGRSLVCGQDRGRRQPRRHLDRWATGAGCL